MGIIYSNCYNGVIMVPGFAAVYQVYRIPDGCQCLPVKSRVVIFLFRPRPGRPSIILAGALASDDRPAGPRRAAATVWPHCHHASDHRPRPPGRDMALRLRLSLTRAPLRLALALARRGRACPAVPGGRRWPRAGPTGRLRLASLRLGPGCRHDSDAGRPAACYPGGGSHSAVNHVSDSESVMSRRDGCPARPII